MGARFDRGYVDSITPVENEMDTQLTKGPDGSYLGGIWTLTFIAAEDV